MFQTVLLSAAEAGGSTVNPWILTGFGILILGSLVAMFIATKPRKKAKSSKHIHIDPGIRNPTIVEERLAPEELPHHAKL